MCAAKENSFSRLSFEKLVKPLKPLECDISDEDITVVTMLIIHKHWILVHGYFLETEL